MKVPDETAGRREAREALQESRLGRRRTQRVVEQAAEHIARLAEIGEENHFVNAIQKMLGGAA